MASAGITIIVNGRSYQLDPNDPAGLQDLSGEDRHQLIALLEALRHRDAIPVQSASSPPGTVAPLVDDTRAALDPDALMAKLIHEEKRDEKPLPTMKSLYRLIAGAAVIIIILVFVL